MSDRKTIYENTEGAAWITLNSPDNRNALSAALLHNLEEDLQRAIADAKARCIVLTGAGTAFCAGADLKSNEPGYSPDTGRDSPFVRVLKLIWNAPKPVIAGVNGAAFAGGLGLVAAADIAITADSVRFSFSEVRIGVIPAVISVVCLPKLGAHHGMRLFLTGEVFDAAAAVSYGLVHRAVAPANLRSAVLEEVNAIRRGGPIAVAESKQLVRRIASQPVNEAFAWAERKSADVFASAEATEGMSAFRQKRPANWIGDQTRE